MTCILHTPTNELKQSEEFYEKLGFQRMLNGDSVLYTDGKAIFEINPDRYARAGVRMYKESWIEEIGKLRELTTVTRMKDGTYLLSDASGVWIYLTEGEPQFEYASSNTSFSVLGKYSGLTLETTDFARSAAVYEILGFKLVSGGQDKGWAAYSNGSFELSIMPAMSCPHLFFNPSVSYFNGGKNLPVIEKIRSLGIPITEEITLFNKEGIVDNIIIRDPGGYGFFVFND